MVLQLLYGCCKQELPYVKATVLVKCPCPAKDVLKVVSAKHGMLGCVAHNCWQPSGFGAA